jgi:hypothetical protein
LIALPSNPFGMAHRLKGAKERCEGSGGDSPESQ